MLPKKTAEPNEPKIDYYDAEAAHDKFSAYAKDLLEADGVGDYQWAVLWLYWLAEEYVKGMGLNPKKIKREGL